jgi:ATP-dependent protease ClpP protease subunit
MPQSTPMAVYATFCAELDEDALNRLFANFAGATQKRVNIVNLLFQSSGGSVYVGVSLYNFFRCLPIELNIYNTGGVASADVLAFIGAKHRYASAHAAFLLHKTRRSLLTPGQAIEHRAIADVIAAEDARSEAILRANTSIPKDKWDVFSAGGEVPITAPEALNYGIIDEIRDFQPPQGEAFFAF